MGASIPQPRPKRRAPQRAVSHSVRRSGKPLFFGWGAHLTHHEREQVKERIAAGIGILLAVAVIGILGAGAVYQYVIKPNQDASAKAAAKAEQAKLNRQVYAVVGGQKITRGWYNAVLKAEEAPLQAEITKLQGSGTQYQSSITQLEDQLQQDPSNVFNYMIGNIVIEQKGAKTGAKVTAADRNKFIHHLINTEFHRSTSAFAAAAKSSGMTASEFRQYQLMNQYNYAQLTKVLYKHVSKKGWYVHVRHILISLTKPVRSSYPTEKAYKAAVKTYSSQVVADKTKAEHVLSLLMSAGNTNAAWKKYASLYSSDSSKTKGGDLGTALATTYVPAFRNASIHQPIDVDKIVHSQFGFHIVEVLGRKHKKLTTTDLQTQQGQALNNWLTKAEAAKGYVVRKYTPPTGSTTTPLG